MESKDYLKNIGVKNIILGISNEEGVIELSDILDKYLEQLRLCGVVKSLKVNYKPTFEEWQQENKYTKIRHSTYKDGKCGIVFIKDLTNRYIDYLRTL